MVTTTAAVTPGATADQGKLAAALRAAGLAEVETAARRRAEYSSDASNYRVVPLVVAFPRSADEVTAALAVCRALNAPIVSRGGGTSIAGHALSTRLVLDLSRHLNHVLHIDPEQQTALVEPGTVLDAITAAAAPHGLRFGPDPSTHSRATIGGAIGNNAGGFRGPPYGANLDDGGPARLSATGLPLSGPNSAGSPGRCPATPLSTCCRRTAPTWPGSSPGRRA